MSVHLLEVARNINNNFESFSTPTEPICDQSGNSLDSKAITISLGLLHDSIEDFSTNFKNTDREISKSEGQKYCEYYLESELGELLGPETANKIICFIKTLSIYNEDEFPTTEYLEQIKRSPYTYLVKLADVDHNLTTFIHFTPVYPCLMIPAQFIDFAKGTTYKYSYSKKLLLNIDAFDKNELIPWHPKTKTIDLVFTQIRRYEDEILVRGRIRDYYLDLLTEIKSGKFDQYLTTAELTKTHIIEQIRVILSTLN
jgi:hypothetical protein